MKSGILLLFAFPVTFGSWMWIGPLLAQSQALGDFCPGGPQPRCASAVQLYLGSNPTDTQIIATVLNIADRAGSERLRAAECKDLKLGMATLAAAVDDRNSAALIGALGDGLCKRSVAALNGPGATLRSLLEGDGGSSHPPDTGSSGSSGQSSGSSGQSSGSSGQSSGSSGQSSGSSGQSSGSSGQSSGSSGPVEWEFRAIQR